MKIIIYRFPQPRVPLGIIRGVVISDREVMTRLRQSPQGKHEHGACLVTSREPMLNIKCV